MPRFFSSCTTSDGRPRFLCGNHMREKIHACMVAAEKSRLPFYRGVNETRRIEMSHVLIFIRDVDAEKIAGSANILGELVPISGTVLARTYTGAELSCGTVTRPHFFALHSTRPDAADLCQILQDLARGRTHLLEGQTIQDPEAADVQEIYGSRGRVLREPDEPAPEDAEMDYEDKEDDSGDSDYWDEGIHYTRGKRVRLDELGGE